MITKEKELFMKEKGMSLIMFIILIAIIGGLVFIAGYFYKDYISLENVDIENFQNVLDAEILDSDSR